MTPFHALLALFAAGFAGMVAVFHRYYYKPEQEEPIIQTPMPEPVQTPQNSPQTSIASEPSMLERFATAIRDFEGKPGDLNYMLNNPGDCRPSPVGYLAKYQPVEIVDTDTDPNYPYHVGKFAKFPTYELGWEYLLNLIQYRAELHPDWTILEFFQNYAPSTDKNPTLQYAETVAGQCGVAVTCTLKELFG